jgi:EAL and modified HD-GYP domain-containing signal transduction protein
MDATPSFWLARQPILDLTGSTVAYELLFRASAAGAAGVLDDRMATASVIAHAFNELGLASVLGSCRGFINFDAELLMSDVVELLPPDRTVIEILETVEITPEVVERCRDLRSRGFSFALDDIVQIDEAHAPILPLVDVIKVDLPGIPPHALPGVVAAARSIGRVKLLAEKVDSHEQADHCRKLGFDLFQGYFFARPVVLQGRRADPARRILLYLLQQSLADTENGEIEASFKQAPELSYKLMRLVNSVGMGLRSPIQSLSHALVILGRRQLQRWLQILLFAHHNTGDFPSPLLQMAAARGKLMELLAGRQTTDLGYADRAFMTGILSLLDTLLESPMAEVIAQINLPDDVRDALLSREGRLGNLLAIAEALERAEDRRVAELMAAANCSMAELPELQIAALSWANAIGEPRHPD